jgi:4-hydroxybenzoate polyprenyltransferase
VNQDAVSIKEMNNQTNQPSMEKILLVVDLDGTLIHSDLLDEGLIILFRKNPLYIFSCIIWLLKGKVNLKKEISNKIQIPYELLPTNKELMSFLQTELSKGRQIILATASLKSHAEGIAKTFPIFDNIFGTEEVNLKGENKLKVLIDEYGEFKFDYIGNSSSDIKIFAKSRYAYLVNPSRSLERKTSKISELKYSWKSKRINVTDYIKAIRVYQWLKNLLIFIPIITSHSFHSLKLMLLTTNAFFAFSMIASSGYVINDLLDLNSDRRHPRKRLRPFASGRLSIKSGVALAVILFSVGIFVASKLNVPFFITFLIYFITSFSYSLYFKKVVLYDVFILALLYSIRVIAGGMVSGIAISFWLIAFSTFLFLSLAFVKRYSELMNIKTNTDLKDRGREYFISDLNLLQIMGIVSGFMSVVVFALYIDSPVVNQLYTHPQFLWGISLLFLFWISRIWITTNRGEMTDDPILYAVKDVRSYFIFILIGIMLVLAI